MGNFQNQKMDKALQEQNYIEFPAATNSGRLHPNRVIQFRFSSTRFLLKSLDTQNYNIDTNVNDFLQVIKKTHPHITSFLLISKSRVRRSIFNCLFDFNLTNLKESRKRKRIVSKAVGICEGLLFLEKLGLHYPRVGQEYLICTPKSEVKLINPFCFSGYLKAVLTTYFSPKVSPKQK